MHGCTGKEMQTITEPRCLIKNKKEKARRLLKTERIIS